MSRSVYQSQRIRQRRDYFTRLCERLPGWRWLRLGAHLVGQVACPRCSGRVLVDLGVISPAPEFRCQQAGCKWLGHLNSLVRAMHFPNQKGAA